MSFSLFTCLFLDLEGPCIHRIWQPFSPDCLPGPELPPLPPAFSAWAPFSFCLYSILCSASINSRFELLDKEHLLYFMATLPCWDLGELLASDPRDLYFAAIPQGCYLSLFSSVFPLLMWWISQDSFSCKWWTSQVNTAWATWRGILYIPGMSKVSSDVKYGWIQEHRQHCPFFFFKSLHLLALLLFMCWIYSLL